MPAPLGAIWQHPGFPSLLVTYGTENDYFLSGHTAITVLGAIEIAHVASPWRGVLAFVIAALEAATVLLLRAHRTTDVFAAALAASLAHRVGAAAAPASISVLLRVRASLGRHRRQRLRQPRTGALSEDKRVVY